MGYTPPIRGKIVKRTVKPQRIPSPYEVVQNAGSLHTLAEELRALRQDIIETTDSELEKVDKAIEKIDGKVGELEKAVKEIKQLEKGEDGQDADEQKIADYVLSEIKDWVHNQIIPQIKQPKDGVSPRIEDIVRQTLIAIPKVDEEGIVSRVFKRIPQNKPSLKVIQESIDKEALIDELLKSPKFKLDIGKIDGLSGKLKEAMDKRYIHGGGDTVSAGTGVTIANVNGTKQINATGGFTILTTADTIDDTNVTFLFTGTPSVVSINGQMFNAGATAGGVVVWTNVGATVTLANPVGEGGSIFAIS